MATIPRVELTPEEEAMCALELGAALVFRLEDIASRGELDKLHPDYKPDEPKRRQRRGPDATGTSSGQ